MNLRSYCLVSMIVLATVSSMRASQSPKANPDAQVLADFTKRVKAYEDLRDKVDGGAATLRETKDPKKISAAQEALAQRIRSARPDAKPGDIFSPEIRKKLLALLRPELKGKAGAETKVIIAEENPGKLPLKVNAKYPEGEPVSTVPPNVLLSLPTLPEDIEYRFVSKHLILRDARANIIVDFMLNAIS